MARAKNKGAAAARSKGRTTGRGGATHTLEKPRSKARTGAKPTPRRRASVEPARGTRPGRREPPALAAPLPTVADLDLGLTEEQRIESAKYTARPVPARLFEEERFLFPKSYGVSRVRLLVKDPYWLFAHWDVAPAATSSLRSALGERAASLAALTLRVSDVVNGGTTSVVLPRDARSWYVRTDAAARSYRAELGLTLPSGEFHHLAFSNTVHTARTGPSPRRDPRVVRFGDARHEDPAVTTAHGIQSPAPGPWQGAEPAAEDRPAPATTSPAHGSGGASDAYRR